MWSKSSNGVACLFAGIRIRADCDCSGRFLQLCRLDTDFSYEGCGVCERTLVSHKSIQYNLWKLELTLSSVHWEMSFPATSDSKISLQSWRKASGLSCKYCGWRGSKCPSQTSPSARSHSSCTWHRRAPQQFPKMDCMWHPIGRFASRHGRFTISHLVRAQHNTDRMKCSLAISDILSNRPPPPPVQLQFLHSVWC